MSIDILKPMDRDKIPDDVQVVQDAVMQASLLPEATKNVVISRNDHERLVVAAGNLAAKNSTESGHATEIERLLFVEEALIKILADLEGMHFTHDDAGLEQAIIDARKIVPPQEQTVAEEGPYVPYVH